MTKIFHDNKWMFIPERISWMLCGELEIGGELDMGQNLHNSIGLVQTP